MSRTDGASSSHFLRALLADTILEVVFWLGQSKYQSYLKQLGLKTFLLTSARLHCKSEMQGAEYDNMVC